MEQVLNARLEGMIHLAWEATLLNVAYLAKLNIAVTIEQEKSPTAHQIVGTSSQSSPELLGSHPHRLL